MKRTRVVIQGAGGRDFHNFNVRYRDREEFEVVAFTAAQIPDIDDRTYPAVLAGSLYKKGIPIRPEADLARLIVGEGIDQVVFSYSDVPHTTVMHHASMVNALGADFVLMGTRETMLRSKKPVVAICAVRTGSGKSQTTRRVCELLKARGLKVAAIRHPMPYGDLSKQIVQRFATYADLDKHHCTIEEREEYEPHIDTGTIVYAGVDYGKILAAAEAEADVIVWDGGNNDTPFYWPDLHIVVADPHRAGHEVTYHPGETNIRMADVVVINKETTTTYANIEAVRQSVFSLNPRARIVDAASPIFVDNGDALRHKRVLVVEDGPTVTHGEMAYGAGWVAAQKYGAAEMIDPRPFAVGSIAAAYKKYTHLERVLPALGYGDTQVKELEKTINRSDADVVVVATPIDIRRVAKLTKPAVRVRYELAEIGAPTLNDMLAEIFDEEATPSANGSAKKATKTTSKRSRR